MAATPHLGMEIRSSGNQSWYDGYLDIRGLVDLMSVGPADYKVDPRYTLGNLGESEITDRRHFDTVQGALDAVGSNTIYDCPVIEIAPAEYQESITIDCTVRLTCPYKPCRQNIGPGRGAWISGDGTQGPPITVSPPNGISISVVLENIYGENRYAAQAATIDKPIFMDILKPATYGNHATRVTLIGCDLWLQTAGDDNLWDYGIRVDGWANLYLEDVDMAAYGYAGGENNGGVRYLIRMIGDYLNSKSATLHLLNSRLKSDFSGSGTPIGVSIDGGVVGQAAGTSIHVPSGDIYFAGPNGTNSITGLSGGAFDTYRNSDLDLVAF